MNNMQDDLIKALTGEDEVQAPEETQKPTDIVDSGVAKDEIPTKKLILRKKAQIKKMKENI